MLAKTHQKINPRRATVDPPEVSLYKTTHDVCSENHCDFRPWAIITAGKQQTEQLGHSFAYSELATFAVFSNERPANETGRSGHLKRLVHVCPSVCVYYCACVCNALEAASETREIITE